MPKLTLQQLDKELKAKQVRPVYLIYGVEIHLIRTAISALKTALGVDSKETSIDQWEGNTVKWPDLDNALRTTSMWSKRKVSLISNADKIHASEQDKLTEYLKAPLNDAVLILTASKADGRTKLVQTITNAGGVLECKPLYDNQIPEWINIEARSLGKQISREASHYLAEVVGRNLSDIANALDKVSLYVGDKKLIDLADVEAVLTETTQKDVFQLGNALGSRSMPKAVHILENLLSFGESPIMILGMIARHWRILLKTKELTRKGRGMPDSGTLASLLKVHPYFVKDYLAQAGNFSEGDLKRSFEAFWRADRALKSSRLPKKIILERLLSEITRMK